MTVMNFIKIYRIDGNRVESDEDNYVLIKSVDFDDEMISISLDNGEHIIEIPADELIKAVKNATNH